MSSGRGGASPTPGAQELPEKLSVVLAHNYYRERGGEDVVFEREAELLRSRGHRVARFTLASRLPGLWQRAGAFCGALGGIYNRKAARSFAGLLQRFRPDLVHVHNTFPLLSPAIVGVCRRMRIPVVATLHNYRLICPAATLYRKGEICQECRGSRWRWLALLHGCYRESRLCSAAACLITGIHGQTWGRSVSLFITPTEFVRGAFLSAGWPAQRICAKPHFVFPDPGSGTGGGRYCLFVGRLAPEKGLRTLLRAWPRIRCGWSLKIVGEGPLRQEMARAAAARPDIVWLGAKNQVQVMELLDRAEALIAPSQCLETFGLNIIEAFARGVPVLASRIGGYSELVREGETGMLFPPGDEAALAAAVDKLAGDQNRTGMGRRARREFERRYSAERNYELLQSVYRRALSCPLPGQERM
jgi:glycosyltransferase involved in cell wall biosynthesis